MLLYTNNYCNKHDINSILQDFTFSLFIMNTKSIVLFLLAAVILVNVSMGHNDENVEQVDMSDEDTKNIKRKKPKAIKGIGRITIIGIKNKVFGSGSKEDD